MSSTKATERNRSSAPGSALRSRSRSSSCTRAGSGSRAPWATARPSGSRFRPRLSRSVEKSAAPKAEQVRVGLQHPQQRGAVEQAHIVLAYRGDLVAPEHHLERLLEPQHLVLGAEHREHARHLADEPDQRLARGEGFAEQALELRDRGGSVAFEGDGRKQPTFLRALQFNAGMPTAGAEVCRPPGSI